MKLFRHEAKIWLMNQLQIFNITTAFVQTVQLKVNACKITMLAVYIWLL